MKDALAGVIVGCVLSGGKGRWSWAGGKRKQR